MTLRPAIWAAALAGSVLLHVALLGGLWLAIRPEPVTDQPMPETRIDVEAYRLDRTAAREEQAQSEPARPRDAAGAQVAAGALPRSRADALAAPSETLEDTVPKGARLAPEPAKPDAAQPVRPPARPVSAATPPARPIADAAPQTARLFASGFQPQPALAHTPPAADVLKTGVPASVPAAVLAPVANAVAPASPRTRPLAGSKPQSASLPAAVALSQPTLKQIRPEAAVLKTTAPALADVATFSPVVAVLKNKEAEPVVTAVDAPLSDRLALSIPATETVLDTTAVAAEVTAAAVPATEPAAPAAPAADVLASARPVADAAAPAAPDAVVLPGASPVVQVAPPAPAKTARLKAALAFSGVGAGDIDPVSLAAFQSFMRPGDIQASGDTLRDGVAGLLAQVPCSRLQVGFDPDSATLRVNGHVPDDDLRAPVLAALRAQMGADIAVSDNILILPRPQCGALSGIAAVGLPQSTDQITNPLLIGPETHAKVFRFAEGELLSLDMTAPDYDTFIYLDYFDAGGDVLHLEPNEYAPLRRADARELQQIGARTMQDTGLRLVIGPPYGQEIAAAFAASMPLYDGVRPISEPAEPYLKWLRRRVAEIRATTPDFKGEWVYFFVTTTAN